VSLWERRELCERVGGVEEERREVEGLGEEQRLWTTIVVDTWWQATMGDRHTRDVSRHVKSDADATQQKVSFRVKLQEESRQFSVSSKCHNADGVCNPSAMISACFVPNHTTYWKTTLWKTHRISSSRRQRQPPMLV